MSDQTEKAICEKLVDECLARGFHVSVYDGCEWPLICSIDRAAILSAMFSTDSDTLRVGAMSGARIGSFLLIYGNGADVLADYSDNDTLNDIAATVFAFAEQFEAA